MGDTKIVEDIIEKKLTGDALAGLYRRYTGRRVLVTTAAATAEFSFVQEASPQDPLTYAQAAELLRKAAVLEGFVFTQHPQDPNLDILTIASGGTGNRGVKLDVFNESTPLPTTDVVITYVMTLNYIKPDQAVNIFTQVVGQFGAYGSISAVPNASAVVITEKASLIKSLIDLQKTIDVPGSVQATRFIPVQYADVTEIATVLTELLTAQQSAQTTAGVQRADAPPPPVRLRAVNIPGQPGGSSAGEAPPVQIVPEPRTNRIFAMGRPVDLIFVEGLVREFDIPSSEKTFLRRKLRFLTVSEFLPIAGDALTRAFSGTGEGGGAGASGGGAAAKAVPQAPTAPPNSRPASIATTPFIRHERQQQLRRHLQLRRIIRLRRLQSLRRRRRWSRRRQRARAIPPSAPRRNPCSSVAPCSSPTTSPTPSSPKVRPPHSKSSSACWIKSTSSPTRS